jgi:TolB-like protein
MNSENSSEPQNSSSKRSLFKELKRRKVFRSAAAYLVVAWLVIQVASIVLPAFDVPNWSMRLVIIMACLGFPMVILFAWAFEMTPDGMKLTPDKSTEDQVEPNPMLNRKRNIAAFAFGAVVPTVGFLIVFIILILNPQKESQTPEKSIAVLPFTNMSSEEENAFFAGGVHEDILTNLAKINDLKVISRTSVMRYGENPENLRQIGEELGARYIVEGSVRRAGESVRVTVQLIDATNDQHLWAENYDRQLVNIFALQSAIAQEIASTLKATISPEEKANLETIPTTNLKAYDDYLKARSVISFDWTGFDTLRSAVKSLESATEADPAFLEAWALLVQGYGQLTWQLGFIEDSADEVEQARELVEVAMSKARSLDPNHVATLRAEGYYFYNIKGDYLSSLRSIDKALALFPNDADPIIFLGFIYRRLGQPDEAIAAFEKAYQLDPANVTLIQSLALAYQFSKRYSEMVPLYEKLAVILPEQTNNIIEAKYYQFLADGSLQSFHDYEHALLNVQQTEKCDLSAWQNGKMTCAMLKGEFSDYAEEWKSKWQAHYEGHGDWVCPVQINEEANHAALLFHEGDSQTANSVVEKALHEIGLPIRENSGCLVETALIIPKLHHLNGDFEKAQEGFEIALIKAGQDENAIRRAFEKWILLECADLIAPDRVYQIYKDLASEPMGAVSLESICSSPWTFPNLLKDPEFQNEVQKDGRFVEFLKHFEFI